MYNGKRIIRTTGAESLGIHSMINSQCRSFSRQMSDQRENEKKNCFQKQILHVSASKKSLVWKKNPINIFMASNFFTLRKTLLWPCEFIIVVFWISKLTSGYHYAFRLGLESLQVAYEGTPLITWLASASW